MYIKKYELKTDYPCDIKLWLMYFFTHYFSLCQKICFNMLNANFNVLFKSTVLNYEL